MCACSSTSITGKIMQGNLAAAIRESADIASHIQIAGVPGRHEPNIGEIDYPFLFDLLDDIGYEGWVGCEYLPRGETLAGLGWLFPDASRAAQAQRPLTWPIT